MEPDRPRIARRRPRRGTTERPIDSRLVRNSMLVVAGALLLAGFSVSRPGPLPAPSLPPRFNAAAATQLADDLSLLCPRRVPGSLGAACGVRWVEEKLGLYALEPTLDVWRQHVAGLGSVELRNLAVIVPGRSPETIVFIAHRDNSDPGAGTNDNATGTSTLIQLASAYARTGTSATDREVPLHTLVFLSSDAGDYGGIGAQRFAQTSPLRTHVVAVVSLDGLGGQTRPRVEISSFTPRSPAAPLLQTIVARVAEQTGATPARPGWLSQVVNLGLPFGYGEQAPLLAQRLPAVRLGTATDTPSDQPDLPIDVDQARFAQLGRASAAILASLDAAVALPRTTTGYVYLGDRVVRGWAIQLILLASLVPFAVATVDLFAYCRRRQIPLRPAARALRHRLGFWAWTAVIVGLAATAGLFPVSLELPPPDVASRSTLGIALVLAAVLGSWLWRRTHGRPRRNSTAEEQLAGYALGMLCLLVSGGILAVCCRYGLIFILPSVYAWIWLPLRTPSWQRDLLYGVGLIGPVLALVVLEKQLSLGLSTPLYAIGLITGGIVPWTATLALLGWAAAAAQIGALTAQHFRLDA